MASVLNSVTWSEAVNGEALTDLVTNEGVTAAVLPEPVVEALREATADTLATRAAADPLTQEVHDSYMAFKANHDRWAGISEGPWLSTILKV
jgi:TRAP-type mannitol/chloroaromatic compound transport system substrate-binding protein